MSAPPPVSKEPRPVRLLMIEDNAEEAELSMGELKRAGFDPHADIVGTAPELKSALSSHSYDLILADGGLPGWDSPEALELLRRFNPDVPVVVVTGRLREETVLQLIRQGVRDFVQKDQLHELGPVVERVLEPRLLREGVSTLEGRVRELERQAQLIAELSVQPLFIESSGRLLFTNGAGVRLLAAPGSESLLDRSLASYVEAGASQAFQEHLTRVPETGEPYLFETWLQTGNETRVAVRIAATWIRYRGEPALQMVIHDLSERRRIEEGIQSLTAYPRLNPNPVLEFSGDGRVTYFNAATAALSKTLGKEHPSAMLPPECADIVLTCLETGQNRLDVKTIQGGRTFSWSFFPIQSTQVVHCYVTEITEVQNLEAQLRHAQKLDSVGRLAGGIAHDIHNVLTVIQGHTSLLRSEPSLSDQMRDSVQEVSRAAERAGKLINQLLAFSRKNVLQPRRLDLNELLTRMANLLHRTLGEDITFQFSYAPDLPPIQGDASLLEQVIMNLGVNARDAMSKGGLLLITTSLVEIGREYVDRPDRRPGEARCGPFVCVSVTDTGAGMDGATIHRLFEPYFTTKPPEKGTGLGLATCYGIVRQHGGWFEVQSQVGQGSTFKFFLPAMDRAPTSSAESGPLERMATSNAETILVVEDEAPVRWTVRSILERLGYHVLEAGNGIEALAIWHQHQDDIDLVLADVVMPNGLTGQELAEQFIAQKPGLKVLYTSGYSAQVAGSNLSMLDGCNFIQKPFDAPKLGHAVQRVLRGSDE